MCGWGLAICTMSQGKKWYHQLFLYQLTLISFLASCALGVGNRKKIEALEQKINLPSVLPGSQTSQHHRCASAPTADRVLNWRLHGVETSLLTEGSTWPRDMINQPGSRSLAALMLHERQMSNIRLYIPNLYLHGTRSSALLAFSAWQKPEKREQLCMTTGRQSASPVGLTRAQVDLHAKSRLRHAAHFFNASTA